MRVGPGAAAPAPAPAVPLHLRAPQDVLLLVHEHGEVLVLALLDGVGASGDGSHFAELQEAQAGQVGVGWSPQHAGRATPTLAATADPSSPLQDPHSMPQGAWDCW